MSDHATHVIAYLEQILTEARAGRVYTFVASAAVVGSTEDGQSKLDVHAAATLDRSLVERFGAASLDAAVKATQAGLSEASKVLTKSAAELTRPAPPGRILM